MSVLFDDVSQLVLSQLALSLVVPVLTGTSENRHPMAIALGKIVTPSLPALADGHSEGSLFAFCPVVAKHAELFFVVLPPGIQVIEDHHCIQHQRVSSLRLTPPHRIHRKHHHMPF